MQNLCVLPLPPPPPGVHTPHWPGLQSRTKRLPRCSQRDSRLPAGVAPLCGELVRRERGSPGGSNPLRKVRNMPFCPTGPGPGGPEARVICGPRGSRTVSLGHVRSWPWSILPVSHSNKERQDRVPSASPQGGNPGAAPGREGAVRTAWGHVARV